jgi:hypothetical protein
VAGVNGAVSLLTLLSWVTCPREDEEVFLTSEGFAGIVGHSSGGFFYSFWAIHGLIYQMAIGHPLEEGILVRGERFH